MHEEADTHLLLHTLHASNAGTKAVVITTEDTDVMHCKKKKIVKKTVKSLAAKVAKHLP